MKPTWTPRDDKQLSELVAKKRAFDDANRAPLYAFINSIVSHSNLDADEITEIFIEKASKIRDILEPYDSGVRPAESSPKLDIPAFLTKNKSLRDDE